MTAVALDDTALVADLAAARAFDAAEAHANRLLPKLLLTRKRAALEFGCGNGAQAIAWARRFEHVIGVDADSDRLAAARRNAEAQRAGNARFVRLAELDRLGAGFDLVHAPEAFLGLPPVDGVRLLEAIAGLVDRGGALAVAFAYRLDPTPPLGPVRRALSAVPALADLAAGLGLPGPFLFPVGRMLRVLDAAGFTGAEIELDASGTAFLFARRPAAEPRPN